MKKIFFRAFIFSFVVLFLNFILFFKVGFMGVGEKSVGERLIKEFGVEVVFFVFKIFLFYLFFALLISFFDFLDGDSCNKDFYFLAGNFFVFTFLRALKIYPQMFTDSFFLKGGFLKDFQIFVEKVPLFILWVVFIFSIFLFLYKKKRVFSSFFVIFLAFFLTYMPEFKRKESFNDLKFENPPILIVASDSLRPDHISFYGYSRKTPNIDLLMRNSINFYNTFSSLARTFPSWTSILTSQFPFEHGIRHMFPDFEDRSKNFYTLSKFLKEKGYFTGVVSDFSGDIFKRIDYGFDKILAPYFRADTIAKLSIVESQKFGLGLFLTPFGRKIFPVLYEEAMNPEPYYLTERTKKLIYTSLKNKKPFFIIVFYSTNHFPYASKFPYYKLYRKRNYDGIHRFKVESLLESFEKGELSSDDEAQIKALYDGGVRLFDEEVGKLIRFLKRIGVYNKMVIVLLSDHGENLFENGCGIGHGDQIVSDYSNRMVFSIKGVKGYDGKIVKKTVRDIDISPTILEACGIKIPQYFRGKPLIKAVVEGRLRDLPCYMETGIWYTKKMPRFKGRVRIFYPSVFSLLEIDPLTKELVLKERYKEVVVNSKHRALKIGEDKLVIMPSRKRLIKRFYSKKKMMRKIRKKRFYKFFMGILYENSVFMNNYIVVEKHYD